MKNSFRILTVRGIEVYVHWTWLLAVAFITWSLGDYYLSEFKSWNAGTAYLISAVSAVLLFATVLIHELAHSFTARKYDLPVRTIYLFIFGGVSNLTEEPQNPRIELFVALAGPLASLGLSILFFALDFAVRDAPSQITAVLFYLAAINLVLALFNLIPGFPLDGGRVLRALLWLLTGSSRRATRIASQVGGFIGYLFMVGGLAEAFFGRDVGAGIWLVFIGWFLHNMATASYQQSVVDRVLVDAEVRQVMDPAPTFATPETPIDALIYRHVLDENQRAVPIIGTDRHLLGLVTLSDTRAVPRQEWSVVPVDRVMTPIDRLHTVSPDDNLRDAMRILGEHAYHQLPVVSDGVLVGMLNRAHLVRYLHVRRQIEAAAANDTRP